MAKFTRIFNFFRFLVFTEKYLHQAYVYSGKSKNGNLVVELYIGENKYSADMPARAFAWVMALWVAARDE